MLFEKQFGKPACIPSTEADIIFSWFEQNTEKSAHYTKPLLKAVYYYDVAFWPVEIPQGYGEFRLNSVDSLDTMPDSVKEDLQADRTAIWNYVFFWADAMDYAWGKNEFPDADDGFGAELLKAAHEELTSAASQILSGNEIPRSVLAARNAVEMFLKSFLAYTNGLTDKGARSFGHNLKDLVAACKDQSKSVEWEHIESEIQIFPEINARYEKLPHDDDNIFMSYWLALSCGAALTRHFTSRDVRKQLYPEGYEYFSARGSQ